MKIRPNNGGVVTLAPHVEHPREDLGSDLWGGHWGGGGEREN